MFEMFLYFLGGIALLVILFSFWGLIRSYRSRRKAEAPPDEIYPLW